MINSLAVTSYRKYLTERIEELTQTHARYKETEGQISDDEMHKMGLNSSAACIWDAKCVLDQCLETFNLEFSADSLPYNLTHLQIGPYTAPKITFKIAEEEITIELEKIKDERGEETLNRLMAKADKYWEFEIQEEVVKIDIMRREDTLDAGPIFGKENTIPETANQQWSLADSLSNIDKSFLDKENERAGAIAGAIKGSFNPR